MDFSSTAISDAPEAEGLAARAVRARHLFTIKTYILPGEFMSGPEAEGQGKRHNIWREAPTTSPWGTK